MGTDKPLRLCSTDNSTSKNSPGLNAITAVISGISFAIIKESEAENELPSKNTLTLSCSVFT